MWTSNIGLRLSFKKKAMCASNFLGLGPLFFKMTGWVPSVGLGFWIYLKSFGSQILDLGLDSIKVMRASRVELGLQFKQSDVNLKPWTWALIHARSDLSSRKVMWASNLKLGFQFKWSHLGLKPWAWAFDLINVLLG